MRVAVGPHWPVDRRSRCLLYGLGTVHENNEAENWKRHATGGRRISQIRVQLAAVRLIKIEASRGSRRRKTIISFLSNRPEDKSDELVVKQESPNWNPELVVAILINNNRENERNNENCRLGSRNLFT
jgi:hypothetical protein